ncbi:PTS transporter subunit EIIB [Escherichia coli]
MLAAQLSPELGPRRALIRGTGSDIQFHAAFPPFAAAGGKQAHLVKRIYLDVKNYAALARSVITALGGADNVVAVTHCMTRLRFVLGDPARVNGPALKAITGVLGGGAGG